MFSKYKYYRGNKDEVLRLLREALLRDDKVLLAVVFGSFTTMESYRDIDVAVYSLDESLEYLAKLASSLELEIGIPVDVIPLTQINPRFRWKILAKGIVVVEKKPGLYEALLLQTIDEIEQIKQYSHPLENKAPLEPKE